MQVRQHWRHVTARSMSGGSAGGADARVELHRERLALQRNLSRCCSRGTRPSSARARASSRAGTASREGSPRARRRRTRAGPETSTLRARRR
jgi:hypothetical protein